MVPVVDVILILTAAPRSTVDAVGVCRCLPIAEVAGMTTATNSSRNSGLLDGLANHDAILLELFGEDSVEEGIATTVERKNENCEHFCSL